MPLLSLLSFLVLFVGSYVPKLLPEVPTFNDVAGDSGVVMILRFHFER